MAESRYVRRTEPVLFRPTTRAWVLQRPLPGVSFEDFTREAMLDLIQRYKAGARNLRPSLAIGGSEGLAFRSARNP